MTIIKAGTTSTTAFSVEQDTSGELVFQAGNTTPLTIANTGMVNIANTASFKVPAGGLAERPNTAANGMMRFNSDWNEFEGYVGGVWDQLTSNNLKLKLDFDETTSLDSRISFTRATNGTYFDSAGVLRTAGSGVARFDHRLENDVWVNKGLLIEEQRTNVCLRSEEFGTTWTTTNASITANQVAAPDGTTTADLLKENTANNVHLLNQSTITITANSAYTLSVFVKSYSASGTSQRYVRLQALSGSDFFTCVFDPTNGDIGDNSKASASTFLGASSQDCGNGWYRFSISGITNTSSTTLTFQIYLRNAFTIAATYTGDNVSGLYLWGAQMEAGAFPTSYIKTTSASATRNADVASMTGTNFSSWYNATEGTMFTQSTLYYDFPTGTFPRIFEIGDNTVNERIIQNCASDLPGFRYIVTDGGTNIVSIEFPTGQANGITTKFANAYKVNDFAGSINGGSVGTDTSGALPTVNLIAFGAVNQTGSGAFLNGHIAKFYYWNTRRPNEILQNLTE